MKKYPKVRRIGHDENAGILDNGHLVVKEKLDGANFRFTWSDEEDKIVFGSRNVEYKNEKDIDKSFRHAVEFVEDTVDVSHLKKLHDTADGDVVVFGEAMHSHTLSYGEPETRHGMECWNGVPSFIGFDVWLDGEFVEWFLAEEILDSLELPIVPIVYDGPADDYVADDTETPDVPESEFRDGKGEGIIIVNECSGQRAKLRTKEFKEKHTSQSVTDPDDYNPNDAKVLARQYTTEARVLKMIHKYRNRGRTIEMSVMEDLWRDVFDDIIEEEYDTIFLGNHVIDTKQFRSEVASITADVLQTYLQRPDGSVLNEHPGSEDG